MVRHAPHGGYLKLMLGPDVVRIEMTDHGQGVISRRDPEPDDPTGRGLIIVDRLAERWGVEQGPDGRGHTVWCDLAYQDAPRRRTKGRRRNGAVAPAGQGVVEATPVAAPPMELNGG
jgi:hypothetical protein